MALGDIEPRNVKSTPVTPVVYRGRDNIIVSTLEQFNGKKFVPLDFSLVTRMILVLNSPGGRVVFDTLTTVGVITFTSAGVVTFDLTPYAMAEGFYEGQLIAFDAQHTGGQVIIDGEGEGAARLLFEVREVFSSGELPPPMPTGGEAVVRTAGEPLSALRVVYETNGQVFLLSQQDGAHIDFMLGITVSAAINAGDQVIVQRSGTIDDAGFSWLPNLVYLGLAGMMTQTVPTTGWELVVGNSPSPQRLNIDFDDPVQL